MVSIFRLKLLKTTNQLFISALGNFVSAVAIGVASANGVTLWRRTLVWYKFTDKGIQAAKETTQRIADWAVKVQSKGVTIKQMYWTLGHYDQVCVFEAADDETAASVLLSADILGNIRTQTLRAFTSVEMEKILANIP